MCDSGVETESSLDFLKLLGHFRKSMNIPDVDQCNTN